MHDDSFDRLDSFVRYNGETLKIPEALTLSYQRSECLSDMCFLQVVLCLKQPISNHRLT